jgi:hypothetical protein
MMYIEPGKRYNICETLNCGNPAATLEKDGSYKCVTHCSDPGMVKCTDRISSLGVGYGLKADGEGEYFDDEIATWEEPR